MLKYIIFSLSGLLFLVYIASFWQKNLKLTFCDVGQGDATIVSIGQTQMLIDAGPNEKVLTCLERHMPFWDKKIEFLVLTHMDADHIKGVPQVLSYYFVDFLFVNPSQKKTSDFKLVEEAVLRKSRSGTRIIHTFLGQKIKFAEQIVFTVINPQIDFPQEQGLKITDAETILSDKNGKIIEEKLAENNENNLSIALLLNFKEVSVFLPGDLEKEGELAMKSYGLLNRVNILKAGHHGSKSSSTPGFISQLQPEIAVISSGKNNIYNHPNPQVLQTFSDYRVDTYQTNVSGEIVFSSDGYHFWEEKKTSLF